MRAAIGEFLQSPALSAPTAPHQNRELASGALGEFRAAAPA